MTEMTCEHLRELAPELALDVLSGDQRAPSIAHLQRCPACRDHLTPLTTISDGLLMLLPGQEPPSGFETRVLDRLRIQQAPARRRRLTTTAAAVVLAAVAGLGGWTIAVATHHEPRPAPSVASAPQHLLTGILIDNGRNAGHVFVYTGTPAWLYMAIDTDHPTGSVTCQLQRADGSLVTIGTFALNHGYGYWGAPIPIDPATVTSARILAADGTLLATARLTS